MKIYNRYDANVVIYEDKEAKTMRECIEYAVKNGFSDLKFADLRGSNLKFADLSFANLKHSDLRGSNLEYSHLRFTNLKHADLRGANLYNAVGNNKEIHTIHTGKYIINIVKEFSILQIGCLSNTFDKWFNLSDRDIIALGGKEGLQFWREWKPILKQRLEI